MRASARRGETANYTLAIGLQGDAAPDNAAIGSWGVDTAGMSRTVRPGDDFYRYVNEGWLKTAQLPPGMASIDPFVEVALSTEQRVADIIKEAREGNDASGTPEKMIADFHRSHSDMNRRNALGLAPIASTLATLGSLKTRDEIAKVMAWPWLGGIIASGVSADADDPRRQIAIIGAAGTTLPSRDYYLNEGEPYAGYREALLAYMAGIFRRAGYPDAEARANRLFALETEIATRNAWSNAPGGCSASSPASSAACSACFSA